MLDPDRILDHTLLTEWYRESIYIRVFFPAFHRHAYGMPPDHLYPPRSSCCQRKHLHVIGNLQLMMSKTADSNVLHLAFPFQQTIKSWDALSIITSSDQLQQGVGAGLGLKVVVFSKELCQQGAST